MICPTNLVANWQAEASGFAPSLRCLVLHGADRASRFEAMIRPVSASTATWSLRHYRRVFVPCFSSSHSPEPHSFSPMLSTSRCTGPEPGRGREPRPSTRLGGSRSCGHARQE